MTATSSRAGAGRGRPGRGPGQVVEVRGAALADVAVQLVDGDHSVAQGGHLADHEHALASLAVRVDLDQVVALAVDALAGDAEPSEVQRLQLGPHLLDRGAGGLEPRPLGGERVDVRAATQRVAWPGRGLEQDGVRAGHGLGLEGGRDRAGGDRLVGETVGGAHQHADARRPARRAAPPSPRPSPPSARRGCRRRRGRSTSLEVVARRAGARSAAPTGRSWSAGPTWPPHSRPSNTNRRAPSFRKRSSRPGDGTWR